MHMRSVKKSVIAAGLSVLIYLPLSASAALVSISGNDVVFTYDDSSLGLYGAPTVVGNSIFFTPTNFKAISNNGTGLSLTSETINIKTTLKEGVQAFNSIVSQERGDYLLLGSGSTVNATGQLRAFDNDHPLTGANTSASITTPSSLNVMGFPTTNWLASASNDLSGTAWSGVRSITSTLENILIATTSSIGSLGFIEKKFVGYSVDVTPAPTAVPLPTSLLLLLSGLLAFLPFVLKNKFQAGLRKAKTLFHAGLKTA